MEDPPKVVKFFSWHEIKEEDFVTSYFIPPLALAILRFWMFAYTIIVLGTSWGNNTEAGFWICYYTNLTYLSLSIYFAASVIHSFIHVFYRRPLGLQRQPKFLTVIFFIQYSTLAAYHIVVPIVYWALLSGAFIASNPNNDQWFQTVSVHAIEFLLIYLDMIFNKLPSFVVNVIWVLSFGILYVLYTFVIHSIGGRWVYGFLDWDQGPIAAGFYLGILLLFVICFFISYGLHRLRTFVGKKFEEKYPSKEVEGKKPDA